MGIAFEEDRRTYSITGGKRDHYGGINARAAGERGGRRRGGGVVDLGGWMNRVNCIDMQIDEEKEIDIL